MLLRTFQTTSSSLLSRLKHYHTHLSDDRCILGGYAQQFADCRKGHLGSLEHAWDIIAVNYTLGEAFHHSHSEPCKPTTCVMSVQHEKVAQARGASAALGCVHVTRLLWQQASF